jgi:hypothetical protein
MFLIFSILKGSGNELADKNRHLLKFINIFSQIFLQCIHKSFIHFSCFQEIYFSYQWASDLAYAASINEGSPSTDCKSQNCMQRWVKKCGFPPNACSKSVHPATHHSSLFPSLAKLY